MKAVVFDRCGEPAEVLRLEERPTPEPRPGQVRVRMRASPINPSDLLFIRGDYGQKPSLPATPGFEGVGVVTASGGGLLGWRVKGRRVAVLNGITGNWQEEVIIPARQAVPVPDGIPDDQAAMAFVNPASAVVMVRHILRPRRHEWLLQTAAGSALGRMVIRLGRRDGFRTLNVVRRREQAEELRQLGADHVICTADESLEMRVRDVTGGEGVRCAIDAVGGATGSEVVRCLGRQGRLLVYGILSGEPLTIPSRTLIAGSKAVQGFWLSDWMRGQGVLTLLGLFREVFGLLKEGVLTSEVGQTFPLDRVAEAVRAAAEPARSGKVLLRFGSGEPPTL